MQLAAEAANLQITWGAWALAGIVPGLICLVATPLILYFIYPPEVSCLQWHWPILCSITVMQPRLSPSFQPVHWGLIRHPADSHSCQRSDQHAEAMMGPGRLVKAPELLTPSLCPRLP